MEITFTPGLSDRKKDDEEETTLEKYKRKMKEKKKKRKEEVVERRKAKAGEESEDEESKEKGIAGDEFFGGDSEDEEGSEGGDEAEGRVRVQKGKKDKAKRQKGHRESESPPPARHVSTAEELALIAGPSGDGANEPKHFNMKAVIKAEKNAKMKNKRKKKGKKGAEEDNELQEDFRINVEDDRFKAVLEDHAFAIDPSNPQYVLAF